MAGAELPLQMQLLLPSELSNSLQGSFAMTAAYLPGRLTCFHGIALPPLEDPRGSVLANSLTGCSLNSSIPLTIALAAPQGLEPTVPTPPLAMGQLCLHLRPFADHSQMETISHFFNSPRPLSIHVCSTREVSVLLSVK